MNISVVRSRWLLVPAFVVGTLYVISQRAVPAYPHLYDGQILYPLLSSTRNLLFHTVMIVLVVAVTLLGLLSVRANSHLMRIVAGSSIFVSCGLSVFACGTAFYDTAGYQHIDTLHLGQQAYHLGFSHRVAWDDTLYVYIVYQCDSSGLFCRKINTPYHQTRWNIVPPQHNRHFVFDQNENTLYVQLDTDLYPVSLNNSP